MLARIEWKRYEEGGRRKPPLGTGVPRYATVIKYCDTTEAGPPQNAFSLIVEKIPSQSTEYEWLANIRYLVAGAPDSELQPGRTFELYEGKRCVALGTVLEGEVPGS